MIVSLLAISGLLYIGCLWWQDSHEEKGISISPRIPPTQDDLRLKDSWDWRR